MKQQIKVISLCNSCVYLSVKPLMECYAGHWLVWKDVLKTSQKRWRLILPDSTLMEIFQAGKVACEKAGKYENTGILLAN